MMKKASRSCVRPEALDRTGQKLPSEIPSIDSARLRATLDGINAFGRNPATGGFNRPGYAEADMAVRRWFAETLAADGLTVTTDAVGNVIGRFGPADGPCVMVGSHLDTVPEGGAFDGALGVAVALECARALKGAGIRPEIAIEVVATAEEEGRFGGMLGSQALADAAWVSAAVDADGVRLADAMRAAGLDPAAIGTARRRPEDIRAFLELHVEQGPVLERSGVSVGIADAVSGLTYLHVRFEGVPNHSGTTPMDLRADAFAGLAEVAAAIPAVCSAGTDQSRITVGKVDLTPNFPHTIPGTAAFTLIIRDTDATALARLEASMREWVAAAAQRHGLGYAIEDRSRLAPTALDPDLVALMRTEAERLAIPATVMPSGAGHDAQTMQTLCPSALVFVPSRGGISHAPQEWTDWADIEKGAAVMLAAVARLAGVQAGTMPF